MNITPKDKIGYISRARGSNGKDVFRFVEAKITKIIIGQTKTSIHSNNFYAIDAEELIRNTKIINNKNRIIVVSKPFITTDQLSEYCRKQVDFWNEYGASDD